MQKQQSVKTTVGVRKTKAAAATTTAIAENKKGTAENYELAEEVRKTRAAATTIT
jgi:hypothetical protein